MTDVESKAAYVSYLRALREYYMFAIADQQRQLDSKLITLSAMLLIASIYLFSLGTRDSWGSFTWLFIISWSCFVSCVAMVLISYKLSGDFMAAEISPINDTCYGNTEYYTFSGSVKHYWLLVINRATLIGFSSGLVLNFILLMRFIFN